MKNKITSLVLGFSVMVSVFPVQVFAQEYDYSAPTVNDVVIYNYTSPAVSSYDYTSPTVSSYNYTSPTVSSYDYTSPTVSSYNYTSPTVSSYNYTSPTVSSYNYTSPTVSSYDYTSPTVSSYNYTSPTVSSYDYTSPTVSSYNYTSPTVSSYDYTSPTVSSYNYTSPTVSSYDYTSPTVSSYNYTSPTVSSYDYTSPTVSSYNYTSPTYSSPVYTSPSSVAGTYNYTYPSYSSPVYSSPTYTSPTYTTPVYTDSSYVTSGIGYTNGYTTSGVGYSQATYPTTYTTGGYTYSNSYIPVSTGVAVTPVTTTTGTSVTVVPTCQNGAVLVNNTCQLTQTVTTGTTGTSYTYPTYGNTTYGAVTYGNTSYGTYNYSTPSLAYQSCWDGSTIPTSSMCPTQYKVCANGTSIPVTQTCYVGSIASPYIAPQKIAFNNVVTSIATQITNTSGRCNAIGLIANNAPSVGWFEFGETANLGRETAHAMIGTSNTAPFSNALVGLKKNKTYYCRAIMKNQYGLVKGEIVSFITKTQPVSYVKPVSLSVKKTTTKTTTKKNELVCVDGKVVSSPSASSATLLNKGEKLIALQIEKTDGALRSESSVSYKISYKNLSDSRLTGMLIKVTVPEEVKLVSQTAGTFDETTHTLTLNQDTIDPYTEGSIMVTGKVEKDAPVGKSVVTTVYALYTVPGTNVQDEVTAYVVGSIVPMVDISKTDTGAKKVIGLSNGHSFLPQSLVEWLALIAILFIIFILGRSIYASYREDEGRSGHH